MVGLLGVGLRLLCPPFPYILMIYASDYIIQLLDVSVLYRTPTRIWFLVNKGEKAGAKAVWKPACLSVVCCCFV